MAQLANIGIEIQLGNINHLHRKSVTIWFEGFTNGNLIGIERSNPNVLDIQFLYFNIALYRPTL